MSMALLKGHLERERATMEKMVGIYCADHHGGDRHCPCTDCERFLSYAAERLLKCPYGEQKPTCSNCPVHCYKPAQREQARAIMRYAGPRMLLRHPWLALLHQVDGFRRAFHPRELTREQRMRSRKP